MREQSPEAIHDWAISAIALGSLRDVVGVLSPLGIDVMPLKGVVLQRVAYDDPSERRLVDVDLAVRSRDFHRAYAALVAAGFTDAHEEPHVWEVSLRRPRRHLCASTFTSTLPMRVVSASRPTPCSRAVIGTRRSSASP